MQGLKSHIVQGRCQHFNPQACPETLPVDDLWRQACLDGKLMEILQSPQNRMRLTIVCQACGKGCRRSSDLALHLQSSHARLWRLSKRLTQILVAALYQQQCYCNPSVGTKRIGHICLPLRQLAMSFHRLGHEPFAPMLITEQVLQHVLTNMSSPTGCKEQTGISLNKPWFIAALQMFGRMTTSCTSCAANASSVALKWPRQIWPFT